MNVFEGLVLEGFHLDVAENFISVPGLWDWSDGRYRIQKDEINRIHLAGDLSPTLNNFTQVADNRKPIHEDGKWIKSLAVNTSNPCYLKSNRMEDFKFLHDGTPFGVYAIVNFQGNTGTQNFNLVLSGGSGVTGFIFLVSVTGILQAIVRNGATIVRSINLAGLYTVGGPNEIVTPNTFIASHVFKGPNLPNNQTNRLDNLVSTSTDTSLAAEYSTDAAINLFINHTTNDTKFLKGGLYLFYKWAGKTPTEIDAYDLRIRNLLNDVKPQFT